MSWDNNPFEKSRKLRAPSFNSANLGGNRDVFNATAMANEKDRKAIQARQHREPTPVELPPHIYPFVPYGAVTIDIRKLCEVAASSTKTEIMRFTCPEGAKAVFTAYGLFNDGLSSDDTEFIPEVDGARAYPYHGDPTANYKMNLGLAPDLSNTSLILAQLILEPGQTIVWYVVNGAAVDVAMGVRMVGYFDTSAKRVTPRFGG